MSLSPNFGLHVFDVRSRRQIQDLLRNLNSPRSARKDAEKSLALVGVDPSAALAKAEVLLAQPLDPSIQVIALRAAGLAARSTRPIGVSVEYLEEAVRVASAIGDPTRAETALSLTGSYALAGRVEEAIALLETERPSDALMAARFDFQRASIAGRLGNTNEALEALDVAIPQFRAVEDAHFLALGLGNRGRVQMETGDLDAAETDLREALAIRNGLGQEVVAAYMRHNLGEVALLRGDLQHAMSQLAESERVLAELTDAPWEPQVTRGDALLSAGLAKEAAQLGKRLVTFMSAAGLSLDLAEAHLLHARSLHRLGQFVAAQDAAAEAAELFLGQGRIVWELRCRMLEVMCEIDPSHRAERAQSLAEQLTESAAPSPLIFEAIAVAARAALSAGQVDTASGLLLKLEAVRQRGLEHELTATTIRALVFAAQSERKAAFAQVRKALRLSERHQASMAAIEFAMSSTWNIAEVAELGVSLAVDGRDPRTIFRYVERSHASALRVRSVRAPADPHLAQLSASVRTLARTMAADPARVPPREFQRALTRLRNAERAREPAKGAMDQAARLGDIRDRLGERVMLSLFVDRGRLRAQQILSTKSSLVDLGPAEEAHTFFVRMSRRLNAAARGIDGSEEAVAAILAESSFGKTLVPSGESEVVLIPPAGLFDAPWLALPELRQRPVTIAASASSWLSCVSHAVELRSRVAVAGPRLAHGDAEAQAIAAIHGTEAIASEAATCETVINLFESMDLLHVACHATHRTGNALFSALELSDGPLMVLDLDRLQRAPAVVVLSSCHSSASDETGAGEMLGLTTAFLRAGTSTVVAGSGLVPDSPRTVALMTRFHERLSSGRSPAEALFDARTHADAGLVDAVAFGLYGGSPTTTTRWAEP